MRNLIVLCLALTAFSAGASTPSSASSSGPYTCNGTTTAFVAGFQFLENAHLLVQKTGLGVTTTLVLGTDYTVTGAGATSGTVNLVAGTRCPTGYTLTIKRVVPLTQPTTLPTAGPYSARIHEKMADRAVQIGQQLERQHNEDLAAQKAKDAEQDLALSQGAVGGSDTYVTATSQTTARKQKDWVNETINVKGFGAVGDGVADDTAAIQLALDRLPAGFLGTSVARRVWFPPGSYRITAELTVTNKHHAQLEGAGAVLVWDGASSSSSVIRFTGAHSRGRVDGLQFIAATGRRALAALRFDGGGGNGEHEIRGINVYGDADWRFDYGVLTTGADANNDHYKLIANHIEYIKIACVRFEQSQSKAHVLIGNRLQSMHPSGYGVSSGGSYYWWGGANGGNGGADFVQTNISGVDAIYIGGVNSEGSRRFFGTPLWSNWVAGQAYAANYSLVKASNGNLYQASTSGTSGATEPTHLAGTESDGGVSWTYRGASTSISTLPSTANTLPLTIESVRFGGYAAQVDGIENIDGSSSIIKPTASLAECDSTAIGSTTVGWAAVINYPMAGPITIRNSQFQPSEDSKVRRFKFLIAGSTAGSSGFIENNMITGSTVKVNPVINASARVHSLGNLLWLNHAGADYGETVIGFPEYHARPAATGRSYVEKAGYGATLALLSTELVDHVSIKLTHTSLDTLTLPAGQTGQVVTLEFRQTNYQHTAMPQTAWPTNIVLTNGPFILPYAYNATATLTLQWDPVGRWDGSAFVGAWVEVARTGAGPVLTGAGSPESAVRATVGTLYVRTDGAGSTLLYRKTTGADTNTGWVVMPAQAAARVDSVAADVATLTSDFNDLLAKLRAAGVLAP